MKLSHEDSEIGGLNCAGVFVNTFDYRAYSCRRDIDRNEKSVHTPYSHRDTTFARRTGAAPRSCDGVARGGEEYSVRPDLSPNYFFPINNGITRAKDAP